MTNQNTAATIEGIKIIPSFTGFAPELAKKCYFSFEDVSQTINNYIQENIGYYISKGYELSEIQASVSIKKTDLEKKNQGVVSLNLAVSTCHSHVERDMWKNLSLSRYNTKTENESILLVAKMLKEAQAAYAIENAPAPVAQEVEDEE